MSHDFASYKRHCYRVLESHGIVPRPEATPDVERKRMNAANVIAFGLDGVQSDKDKFTLWCAESLLYAFRQIECGEIVQAFRAYSQFREYVGRLNGWDPLAYSDAGSACCRAIEDSMRAVPVPSAVPLAKCPALDVPEANKATG